MKAKGKRTIPNFNTCEEAAAFFDKTDTMDLNLKDEGWETFFEEPVEPKQRQGKSVHIPVRLGRAEFKRLSAVARKNGQTPKAWLTSAVKAAIRQEPRAKD